jgi:hypothetical protein
MKPESRNPRQSHPKPPKATRNRRKKAECRKAVHARYKPSTSQVQRQVQARYMRGSCMVHAWYKPPQSHPEAKRDGGERPCSGFAPVGIWVALQWLVPIPAGMRSTVSRSFPAKSRMRWKAFLPSEVAPGRGTLEPLKRLPCAAHIFRERGHSCPPVRALVYLGVGFGVDQRARADKNVRAPTASR